MEYRQSIVEQRQTIIECRQINIEYRQSIVEYRQTIIEYRQIIIEYRQINIEYTQIIIEYRQLIIEYRQIIQNIDNQSNTQHIFSTSRLYVSATSVCMSDCVSIPPNTSLVSSVRYQNLNSIPWRQP